MGTVALSSRWQGLQVHGLRRTLLPSQPRARQHRFLLLDCHGPAASFVHISVVVVPFALTLLCALRFGTAQMSAEALLHGDAGLLSGRGFRALCAMTVGAALAVSGLMLQSLTGNPLADPGITGINAGAALMAVATAQFAPSASAGW